METDIKGFCLCFWSFYYLFHCCLFTSTYVREEHMDNNCIEYFKKKYNKYFNDDYNVIEQ